MTEIVVAILASSGIWGFVNTMLEPIFAEKGSEICDIIKQYVDNELARSERDIKGNYLLQMTEKYLMLMR